MKVAVLKDFPIAIDAYGVRARDLVAGTVDDVDDASVPSLVDEGYVSLNVKDAVIVGDGAGQVLPLIVDPVVERVAPAVEIPADWQKAHHKTRIALAKKLGASAEITADKADELISAEVARRAGE